MIHYSEGGKRSNLSVNCGVYLFKTTLFTDPDFYKVIRGQSVQNNE